MGGNKVGVVFKPRRQLVLGFTAKESTSKTSSVEGRLSFEYGPLKYTDLSNPSVEKKRFARECGTTEGRVAFDFSKLKIDQFAFALELGSIKERVCVYLATPEASAPAEFSLAKEHIFFKMGSLKHCLNTFIETDIWCDPETANMEVQKEGTTHERSGAVPVVWKKLGAVEVGVAFEVSTLKTCPIVESGLAKREIALERRERQVKFAHEFRFSNGDFPFECCVFQVKRALDNGVADLDGNQDLSARLLGKSLNPSGLNSPAGSGFS
jgi:hypothetical protein